MTEIEEAIRTLCIMESQYSHIRHRETEWTAVEQAIAVLHEQLKREQNESLTLEELREMAMAGDMAWCADTDGVHPGLLCLAECVLSDGKDAHIWLLDEEGHVGRYNVQYMLDCGAKFHRRPPEE